MLIFWIMAQGSHLYFVFVVAFRLKKFSTMVIWCAVLNTSTFQDILYLSRKLQFSRVSLIGLRCHLKLCVYCYTQWATSPQTKVCAKHMITLFLGTLASGELSKLNGYSGNPKTECKLIVSWILFLSYISMLCIFFSSAKLVTCIFHIKVELYTEE